MSSAIRVCLYNSEPESSAELRAALAALDSVRLQDEVATAEELAQVLSEPVVGLVVFHLDPDPPAVIEIIQEVITHHPDVALIGISHDTNPNTILTAMRAGCDQFVCEPIDPTDLANAVSRVTARRLSILNKSRCICVIGASGGAGATSITCNLALEIGQLSASPCAVVDLDLQFGNAAANFDCQPKYTLRDAVELGPELDRSALASSLHELPSKVALLARPDQVSDQEGITPEVVSHILRVLATLYDHIIVDLPRSIDARTFAAMEHADAVLIVCQQSVPSVRNAQRIYSALLGMGMTEDRVHVIVNRFTKSSARIQLADVEEAIGKPILGHVPNDYALVTHSVDFGRPISTLDKNNPIRVAIRGIARQVAGSARRDANAADKKEKPSKGLFSRLLGKT